MDVEFLVSNQWQRSNSDPNRVIGPAPTVVSINRLLANPSGAANVTWQVKFTQSVSNVGTTDFAIIQAGGVTGASITSVTDSGNHITYTVTANSGANDGTLGLNLVDDDTIVNVNNTPLGGAGTGNGNFTGQVYTITRAVQPPGWFTIMGVSSQHPNNLTVTNKALTGNVATLTFSTKPLAALAAGRAITVAGVDAIFNGDYTIASIKTTSPYNITYNLVHANVGSAASGGTIDYYDHRADNYIAATPGTDLGMFNYMNTEYAGFIGKSSVLKLRHVYNGATIPASYSAGAGSTPAGINVLMATKGTDAVMMDNSKNAAYVQNLSNIASQAPSSSITYVTWNHEPERAGPATAPNWRAAFARFAKALIDNRGSNRVYPVACLQQFTWQTTSPQRDSSIWNPAAELAAQGVNLDDVVIGCDTYAPDPTKGQPAGKRLADSQKFRDRVATPFADFRSWGFKRVCVPECGAFNLNEPQLSATRTWLNDMAISCGESQIEFIAYFNSNVGASVGIDGWLLYDDGLKTLFAQIADAGGVP